MLIRPLISAIPLLRLRWLILLIFPLVSLLAKFTTGSMESAYYLSVAMAACAWLLYRLDSLRPDMMGVWLVLLAFLAIYFLRYPILLLVPAYVASTHPDSIAPIFFNDQASLTRALKLSSFVFIIFCLVAGIQLPRDRVVSSTTFFFPSKRNNQIKVWLLIVVPLLMILLGYIAYAYKIGQMGVAPGEPLPFRLKGIVFYARHVLIPLLILALLCNATFTGDHRSRNAGLLLLVIHGISDTILRGSRSSLLLCLLLVVFLWASGGIRVRPKELIIIIGLSLGAILLLPTINEYRSLRFNSDANLLDLLLRAFGTANKTKLLVVQRSFETIYFRIPGIETIWAIGSLVNEPLGTLLLDTMRNKFGVTGYLNFEIYQVPLENYTLYAPGFVGWLYLAGGWLGLLMGSIILALLCVHLPRYLYSGYLRWSPLANTFFLWVLFISLTDGTLDSNFPLIVAGMTTLVALEFFDRLMKPSARA
jgi:hypothetical protein